MIKGRTVKARTFKAYFLYAVKVREMGSTPI